VVVADLSTSNKNAYYELGVRHALRPYTTVIICEDGAKTFPFDVNHVLIRQYHHMGDGIDFEEVERFRKVLTDAIVEISNRDPRPSDSPVYSFLDGLTPPALAAAMHEVAEAAAKSSPAAADAPPPVAGGRTHSELMEEVDAAQAEGDFVTARALLSRLRRKMKEAAPDKPEDPYIVQRLALLTYKSKQPSPQAALEEARALLLTLNPVTSNDTETLGLWGSVHKRLWDLTQEPPHLNEAVRGYERGFYLRSDYYNGINLAYLLNVRSAAAARRAEAAPTPAEAAALRAEAVADFVQAGRIRREVLNICEDWLAANPEPKEVKASAGTRAEFFSNSYWVLATLAEALLGVGDEAAAQKKLEDAFAAAPEPWMKESTEEQLKQLRRLLAESPLKYVKDAAP
jgi:hypothetical protein